MLLERALEMNKKCKRPYTLKYTNKELFLFNKKLPKDVKEPIP